MDATGSDDLVIELSPQNAPQFQWNAVHIITGLVSYELNYQQSTSALHVDIWDKAHAIYWATGLGPSYWKTTELYFPFIVKHPNIVIAGGAMLRIMESETGRHVYNSAGVVLNTFTPSDIDMYIRANSLEEAINVFQDLFQDLQPSKEIIRTANAITFYVHHSRLLGWHVYDYQHYFAENGKLGYVKVQIIDQILPNSEYTFRDLQPLFDSYDLDCCKFALAYSSSVRKHLTYTTRNAIKSITTRVVTLQPSKIGDTTIGRLRKYWRRGFDFVVAGYNPSTTTFPAISQVLAQELDSSSSFSTVPTHKDLLMYQMKQYGKFGTPLYAIVGNSDDEEDVAMLVSQGKQSTKFLADWFYTAMNKLCEITLYMAIDDEQGASKIRDVVLSSLQRYIKMMESVCLGPLFVKGISTSTSPSPSLSIDNINLWTPSLRIKLEKMREGCFICENV